MTQPTRSNREHSFDWELAVIVGLEKAILLKNISYWVEENRRRALADYYQHGEWWTRESLRSLAEKYPYFTKPSISRWMNQLCTDGWIRMFGQTGGTNFYTPGEVFNAWNSGGDWKALIDRRLSGVSQNEIVGGVSQNETGVSQNETVGVSKWDTGCLKMRHTNSDVDNNVELNVERGRARQKNTPTDFRKRHTSMPSSGPAPHRFSESEWFLASIDLFATHLHQYAPETTDADPAYYRNRLRDWSAQNPAKLRPDWLAVAAQFISDDRAKNKLVTINNATDDTARHTILVNPITGNTTNLQRVTDATKAARRVMEKWAKAS